MDKKFELTDETIKYDGKTLYRIRALKDFGNVTKGDLGGFIEKENNLSQEDNCWIYNNAKVYDSASVFNNARIFDNAVIRNNAEIYGNTRVYDDVEVSCDAKVFDNASIGGNAQVFGNAFIYGKANVCGDATIYDNARIYGNVFIFGDASIFNRAKVYGDAQVFNDARVGDDAQVFDDASVFNNAFIYGDAQVFGRARVYGNASVCGNAILKEDQVVRTGICKVDLSKNLKENIRCQTNLFPQKDYVIAYKQVRKDLTSFYDETFQYKIGEWIEVEEPEISDRACTTGLHFSNPNYWDIAGNGDATYLMAKIMFDDIITIQCGKIRCKRAFILDKYEIED